MPRNLREALRGQIPDEELKLIRAFDIIGDIAVVKIPKKILPKKQLIGQALMQVHHHVRTVLNQTTPVRGEFRTRELEVIAGAPRTETTHREGGCSFKADLAKVYFSPRLATERLRVTKQIKPGEVVVNLFAGVGCYSVLISKHSEASKIYSIDKNPEAVNYMRENIRTNKVGARVVPILGDAREVVKTRLMGKANRILMPLPELAREFFDIALLALKPEGGVVHFYDFGKEPELFDPSLEFARITADTKGKKVELLESRAIRSYATKVYHIVLDLKIT